MPATIPERFGISGFRKAPNCLLVHRVHVDRQQHSSHRLSGPYCCQNTEYAIRSLAVHCRLFCHCNDHGHRDVLAKNPRTCLLHVNVFRLVPTTLKNLTAPASVLSNVILLSQLLVWDSLYLSSWSSPVSKTLPFTDTTVITLQMGW